MKVRTPSPALAAIVGSVPLPRAKILQRVWQYVLSNSLQSQTIPKSFKADAKLRAVIEEDARNTREGEKKKRGPNPGPSVKPSYTMFEFSKALSRHLK